MVSEEIRDADAGYQETSTLPGGEVERYRVQPAAYTIAEFCQAFRVSRGHFYNLVRRGEGPRLLRVGKRVLVSADSVAEWVRRSEVQLTRGADR